MSQPAVSITPEEYLAIERKADHKSEYYAGEMFAMAGATYAHGLIVMNAGAALHGQLQDGRCRVVPQDLRVKVSRSGLYTYPDLVVVCGQPEFDDAHGDTLTNPTVLVEVLSPSTEGYDRGVKFGHYRKIESLQHYVTVAQDRPQVECFTRRPEGEWSFREAADLDAELELGSIGCRLRLADVYAGVEFSAPGR